jgi:hypothetical protein
MTASETAWVDNGAFSPNRGQFPIQVERHLNAFVADHLPGVTTVTLGARYYSLHAHVAFRANEQGLDEDQTRRLLRRSEAMLAYVTARHSSEPDHPDDTPPGHGIDAILRLADGGTTGIDLSECAKPGAYSLAKWGFSGAYRGSELTLKILDQAGFLPGAWHDLKATAALDALVQRAQGDDALSAAEADQLADACLCTMAAATDGPWLAQLLAGEPNSVEPKPTRGGLLWQLGRLVTIAITTNEVRGSDQVAELIMFDHTLADHQALAGMVGVDLWRGGLLRAESVWAWRRIWRDINETHLKPVGALPVVDLVDAFAAGLRDVPLSDFLRDLPSVADDAGRPLNAERQLDHLGDLERWMAIVMLGSQRAQHLNHNERIGFAGGNELNGTQWEELTPGWTEHLIARHANSSLRDLGRDMAQILISRSQRVALRKANYDPVKQAFSFPARIHVRDGIAIRVFAETAPAPATRLPQYLSIARQAGLYATGPTGNLIPGINGGFLA